jgi:hypothetical protein
VGVEGAAEIEGKRKAAWKVAGNATRIAPESDGRTSRLGGEVSHYLGIRVGTTSCAASVPGWLGQKARFIVRHYRASRNAPL